MLGLGNQVALNELKKALDVLNTPHDKLPKVTDKNGVEVTDVKDKRLMLVAQHIGNAGDIINLIDSATVSLEMGITQAIRAKHDKSYIETVKRLAGGKIPPQLLGEFEGEDDGDDEPRQMGFAHIVKQMQEKASEPK